MQYNLGFHTESQLACSKLEVFTQNTHCYAVKFRFSQRNRPVLNRVKAVAWELGLSTVQFVIH